MECRLDYIFVKQSDFKVCKGEGCNHINWYENEECFFCGHKGFEYGQAVDDAINLEYEWWQNEYGYEELECDSIEIEV